MKILNYSSFINEIFNYPKETPHKTDKSIQFEKERYTKYYDGLNREYELTYKHSDFQKIWKRLEKDCKQFLDEIKRTNSDLIYRGAYKLQDNETYGMDKKRTRRDRYSKDMNPDIQILFDEEFDRQLGVRLRSECVFTTKDPLQAEAYAGYSQERKRKQPYLFFPIGEYKYYCNPDIDDLFTKIEDEPWYYRWHYIEEIDYLSDYDLNYEKSDWFKIYGDPEKQSGGWNNVDGGGKGKRVDGEWIPDVSLEDYFKNLVNDIEKEGKSEIKRMVSGYKEGGLSEIKHQEITFDCDEYYLVDDVFLYKILKKLKRMK